MGQERENRVSAQNRSPCKGSIGQFAGAVAGHAQAEKIASVCDQRIGDLALGGVGIDHGDLARGRGAQGLHILCDHQGTRFLCQDHTLIDQIRRGKSKEQPEQSQHHCGPGHQRPALGLARHLRADLRRRGPRTEQLTQGDRITRNKAVDQIAQRRQMPVGGMGEEHRHRRLRVLDVLRQDRIGK